MVDKEGPVLHQNQNQDQDPNSSRQIKIHLPMKNPQNLPPPLNPFMPNAPVASAVPQRPQFKLVPF